MFAIGMPVNTQIIPISSTNVVIAPEIVNGLIVARPIIISNLIFDITAAGFTNGGQFIFRNNISNSIIFSIQLKGASVDQSIMIPWYAEQGLNVTTPAGGEVTVFYNHIGR